MPLSTGPDDLDAYSASFTVLRRDIPGSDWQIYLVVALDGRYPYFRVGPSEDEFDLSRNLPLRRRAWAQAPGQSSLTAVRRDSLTIVGA